MKSIYKILFWINKTEYNHEYYKSIINRIKQSQYNKSSLKSKMICVLALCSFPLLFLFKAKRNTSKTLLIGDTCTTLIISDKIEFASKLFNVKTQEILYMNESTRIRYNTLTYKILIKVLKIWLIFIVGSLIHKRNSELNHSALFHTFINVINIILCNNTNVLVFNIHRPSSYLTLAVSELLGNKKLYASLGSSRISAYNNITYIPNNTVVVCANYQHEELSYYKNIGSFTYSKSKYNGSESISRVQSIKELRPKYDIGIYSSGYWARKAGILRVNDIEGIKSMKYKDNMHSDIFEKILIETTKYTQQHQLKLKIYLHPYERELWLKHGISPPFLKYLTKDIAEVDKNGESSMEGINEVKLGLSLMSTISFERWDMGLDSYIILPNHESYTTDIRALGKYAKFVHTDPNTVYTLLEEYFKKRDKNSSPV